MHPRAAHERDGAGCCATFPCRGCCSWCRVRDVGSEGGDIGTVGNVCGAAVRRSAVAVVCCAAGLSAPVAALGASGSKLVRFHGYRLAVPAGWPVYRLASDRNACVRFDRHAVYLGRPGADQRCPAHAAGRTEAILIEPLLSRASRDGGSSAAALPLQYAGRRSSVQFVNRPSGVVVTATWGDHPAAIEHALGVRSLGGAAALTGRPPARAAIRAGRMSPDAGHAAQAGHAGDAGDVYTGVGFDACSTPSPAQMSAWSSSPYRAIGVYVGGANMACSQANLTANWVSQQSAAGWHLIPTYVGLQAPTNSCGCAGISVGSAATQGAAAATDAVARAQAIGLGPGNPLYFDMEAYPRGGSNSAAVLAFLASWTTQLHAGGYQSGVYSSADSGILDLAGQLGTGYQEPDDIWIARWNAAMNTSDPNVPTGAWASHQRLHQYSGAHNETYGAVTLNIDGDYLDGATAAAGGGTPPAPPPAAPPPSLSVSPAADGGIDLYPSWSSPSAISSWQVMAGPAPTALAPAAGPVSAGVKAPIVIHSAFPYFAVQALGSAGQILGSSSAVATPAHVAIFGQSAFVSPRGTGGMPVGCFSAAACHVTTTISAGRTVLASTGSEQIPIGGGLAYFTMTPTARAMLARARGRRLAVRVTVRDATGLSAARSLALIPFVTSGPSPQRSLSQSSDLWIIGTTDFVSHGWVGGLLAACVSSTPCHPRIVIAAGGKTIARTAQQFLGVNQVGYLFFSLTAAGHTMLAQARGNQLPRA